MAGVGCPDPLGFGKPKGSCGDPDFGSAAQVAAGYQAADTLGTAPNTSAW
jgi:hypothetical protein